MLRLTLAILLVALPVFAGSGAGYEVLPIEDGLVDSLTGKPLSEPTDLFIMDSDRGTLDWFIKVQGVPGHLNTLLDTEPVDIYIDLDYEGEFGNLIFQREGQPDVVIPIREAVDLLNLPNLNVEKE